MVRFGYTLMTEQAGPRALVEHAVAAEQAGFDFEVMSDHYSPWLDEQGHAPYAWSVLGAVAQATDRVELMTYVTCPTMRYHPAVVAQKAATVQELFRRPVHPRARCGGEPQRARGRRGLAPGQRAARDARRGHRHHRQAVHRRLRRLRRQALPGRLGEAVGPARAAGAVGRRGVRRAVGASCSRRSRTR